jgi:hypothetical protein
MRFAIIARAKFPIPPEQLGMVTDGFAAWRERHRDRMEVFEFLVGGNGGFGIVNADDVETLNQMMTENPLFAFSEVEVWPTINGDVALKQWRETLAQMMAGAPA